MLTTGVGTVCSGWGSSGSGVGSATGAGLYSICGVWTSRGASVTGEGDTGALATSGTVTGWSS